MHHVVHTYKHYVQYTRFHSYYYFAVVGLLLTQEKKAVRQWDDDGGCGWMNKMYHVSVQSNNKKISLLHVQLCNTTAAC